MPNWSCGARDCPGHAERADVCASGAWSCRRRTPRCPGHGAKADQCAQVNDAVWNCGANACPGHSGASHNCQANEGRSPSWTCNLIFPVCPGHSNPSHHCHPESIRAREQAECNMSNRPAGGSTQPCPEEFNSRLAELVEKKTHNGSARTQTVSARRQYINMDENVDSSAVHFEYGRSIALKARLEWNAGDQSRSLAGKKIYWYYVKGGSNRTGLANSEKEGFNDTAGSNRIETIVNAEGWAEVTFRLSSYGGDEFEIYATDNSGYRGGLKAGKLTVWRRMWYEITEMRKPGGGTYSMPAATLNTFKSEYASVFIELLSAGSTNQGVYQANFDNHEDAWRWADRYVANSRSPFKMHFAVMNYLCPTANRLQKDVSDSCTAVTNVIGTQFVAQDFNGANWLISAKYKKADGSWENFAAGKVTKSSATGRTRIRIDFSGASVTPTAANPVDVEVHYHEAFPALGWGGSCLHLAICAGMADHYYSGATLSQALASVAVHEAGHSLGLVYGSLSWKSTTNGSHCNLNSCVMWYQVSPGGPTAFHPPSAGDPGCGTFVRAKDMSRAQMSTWRFPRS